MRKIILAGGIIAAISMSGCGTSSQLAQRPTQKTITVNSEPTGARVVADGQVVCSATPCTVTIPLTYHSPRSGMESSVLKAENMNAKKITFIKNGYVTGEQIYKPKISIGYNVNFEYPDGVFHIFEKQAYTEDPTIRAGAAEERVTRDAPGKTALERTIIRWNFDSDPRGCRIFWRVISSVPDEVKNTNELYLTTTPYEETRSFNILGLTYENSRDVTVEIKVTKKGFHDQVKRYNVRQAIDQQEIGGFFEMVENQ